MLAPLSMRKRGELGVITDRADFRFLTKDTWQYYINDNLKSPDTQKTLVWEEATEALEPSEHSVSSYVPFIPFILSHIR